MPRLSGEFSLCQCHDIEIRRCFSDSRGGYTARFVTAWDVDGLRVKNCVYLDKMGGMMIVRCPNLRVSSCVIARPKIACFILRNEKDQPAIMENNIFTDMLKKKALHNINLFVVDGRIKDFHFNRSEPLTE